MRPISRSFWKPNFPSLLCPSCNTSLHLNQSKENESANSKVSKGHEAWDPTWVNGTFIGRLVCQNNGCGENIYFVGTYAVELTDDFDYESKCHLSFFTPTINLFPIPEKVPPLVKLSTQAAFAVYWCDLNACANRIRQSIELLLDHLGVKKSVSKTNKKRLTLHERIKEFEKKNKVIAEYLLASKWIGNAGSHAEPLQENDIWDGFNIFSLCLERLFDDKEKQVKKLATQINRTKKPRSK